MDTEWAELFPVLGTSSTMPCRVTVRALLELSEELTIEPTLCYEHSGVALRSKCTELWARTTTLMLRTAHKPFWSGALLIR